MITKIRKYISSLILNAIASKELVIDKLEEHISFADISYKDISNEIGKLNLNFGKYNDLNVILEYTIEWRKKENDTYKVISIN